MSAISSLAWVWMMVLSWVFGAPEALTEVTRHVGDRGPGPLPAPVIYKAPAAGDTIVTVLALPFGETESATISVNDGAVEYNQPVPPGSDRCDVPVRDLSMGDTIRAYYTIGGLDSDLSEPETVTTDTTTAVLADDFESYADQAAMEAVWTQSGAGTVLLDASKDATGGPGGWQCAQIPDSADPEIPPPAYMTRPLRIGEGLVVPTETAPVVWNVDIYDPVGPDPDGTVNEWVELNHYGGPDSFLAHLGMCGWGDTNNNSYDFRASGNGGPGWVDLDEFDAPLRSEGWHTFTMVHKGSRIDVYVDGLLSKKNIQLTDPTTYARADVGGGYNGDRSVWADDFYVETGPVWFGSVPGPQATGDVDRDGDVDLSDLAALLATYGECVGDPNWNAYADFDDDGCVTLSDLASLLGNYGYPG